MRLGIKKVRKFSVEVYDMDPKRPAGEMYGPLMLYSIDVETEQDADLQIADLMSPEILLEDGEPGPALGALGGDALLVAKVAGQEAARNMAKEAVRIALEKSETTIDEAVADARAVIDAATGDHLHVVDGAILDATTEPANLVSVQPATPGFETGMPPTG